MMYTKYTPIIIFIFIVTMPRCALAKLEVHLGAYGSMEYSDNYNGTPHDERSDVTYEAGPSLEIKSVSRTLNYGVSGHITRSDHRHNDQDNTTEAMISGNASITGLVNARIEYTKTREREYLDQAPGFYRRYTGNITLHRDLSAETSISTGYTRYHENAPDEDITDNALSLSVNHAFTHSTTGTFMAGYDDYSFEIRNDVSIFSSEIDLRTDLTPKSTIGPTFEYAHHARDKLNDEDVYTMLFYWIYALRPTTTLTTSIGRSWLDMQNESNHSETDANISLSQELPRDTISVGLSRSFTIEYNESDRYGTYRTKSATISWEHRFSRDLSTRVSGEVLKRKPTEVIPTVFEGREKDITANGSIVWHINRYVTVNTTYEHLEHHYQFLDAERENRYRLSLEVLY